MNESPQYEAFRAFARSEIRAGKLELKAELTKEIRAEYAEEIRSLRTELETRSAKVIEGPPGPAGKDGADGKPGVDGKDGKDGLDGKTGERGADGIIGRDGKDGLNGKDGSPGEKGERGADGVATREEIEMIVEQRFADVQTRTFADLYQGVWQQERETYTRSQCVTWGGHLFLCLKDTKGKPAESPDWRLIVKAGRDGKK